MTTQAALLEELVVEEARCGVEGLTRGELRCREAVLEAAKTDARAMAAAYEAVMARLHRPGDAAFLAVLRANLVALRSATERSVSLNSLD
jgi:hypothetical protein